MVLPMPPVPHRPSTYTVGQACDDSRAKVVCILGRTHLAMLKLLPETGQLVLQPRRVLGRHARERAQHAHQSHLAH